MEVDLLDSGSHYSYRRVRHELYQLQVGIGLEMASIIVTVAFIMDCINRWTGYNIFCKID